MLLVFVKEYLSGNFEFVALNFIKWVDCYYLKDYLKDLPFEEVVFGMVVEVHLDV